MFVIKDHLNCKEPSSLFFKIWDDFVKISWATLENVEIPIEERAKFDVFSLWTWKTVHSGLAISQPALERGISHYNIVFDSELHIEPLWPVVVNNESIEINRRAGPNIMIIFKLYSSLLCY